MITRKAIVTWLPYEEGGRSVLPAGHQYATIAKFPDDGPEWPQSGGWTIVMNFETPPQKQGSPSIGTARFLVEEAPKEKMDANSFQLYEGLRKVADVELVE